MQSVSGSQSINTGTALQYLTVLTGAINVRVGTITSSSGLTLQVKRLMCRADVPLTAATACLAPI